MEVRRAYVEYRGEDGEVHRTKIMSRAEANETARQLRFHGTAGVYVKAPAPRPAAGYDENWRIVP